MKLDNSLNLDLFFTTFKFWTIANSISLNPTPTRASELSPTVGKGGFHSPYKTALRGHFRS